MAVREILIAPDPRLKLKARRVDKVDATVRKLMDDMLETMYAAPGIGLAAPQVGEAVQVIVLDVARDGEPRQPLRMANPEIVWASDERVPAEEGCLSLPDQFAEVTRPAEVKVRYLDHENEIRELHEMDHLRGVLFVDHISTLRRNMILRKLVKKQKTAASA
jgi:peptide deformylase